MKFDARTRRYITNRNRVIHPRDVRKRIDEYIRAEQEKISRLAQRTIEGDVSVAKFFRELQQSIRTWHSTAGVIAYGGEEQMNRERWLRIDQKIDSELAYLADFKAEIQAADEITAMLESRAAMYAESTFATYENNVMAREFDSGVTMGRRVCEEDDVSCEECVDAASTYFSDLGDLPEIGTLQCLTNCRCYFEFAQPIGGFDQSMVGQFTGRLTATVGLEL